MSHRTFDHTSILKFIETKWNLPALTYRDANANDMLDFFDLTAKKPPFAEPPMLTSDDIPGSYDYTGFRVPCCVVSAWSKKDYVSHRTFDHTSILKFVETKWNLPALTYRDANADNMLDFLDLTAKKPPFTEPPDLKAPKNPLSSAAALPASSITTADQAMFHTTCTDLPAGSLPPADARLAAVPPHAEALIAAQRKRIEGEIQAQV